MGGGIRANAMSWLFLAGEAPGEGGYMVVWPSDAPPVQECRPVLDQLCVHDWSGRESWRIRASDDRLSWRIIGHDGACHARGDAADRGSTEEAWLAGVDLRVERGRLAAREPGGLLVLVAGQLRLDTDQRFRALLARSHHFVDYTLGFLGPEGEWLTEETGERAGSYRFREKHEGFVIAERDAPEARMRPGEPGR